jgi:hypothetical protein
LVLVFSTNLKQIEEVGGRGMDGDEVLCGFGIGCGEVKDFEVFRALVMLVGRAMHEGEMKTRNGSYLDIFLELYALHCKL